MRIAAPDEGKERIFPVMTAHISRDEMFEWFPHPLHHITDPWAEPEPSYAVFVQLESGHYAVAIWGEMSSQLKLHIMKDTDPTEFLAAFFREVPLPFDRIIWTRDDARLPQPVAAKRVAVK
jgi:hypothetical protein